MQVMELGGAEKDTTNNRMELMAAMNGLRKVAEMDVGAESITVYSDSSYVISGITRWVAQWKRGGWKTKNKDDVQNKNLWLELDEAVEGVGKSIVSWKYVGGHVGIAGNERCDEIATAFADGRDIKLYHGPLSKYHIPNILDIAHDAGSVQRKKTTSARQNAKAYSYVSYVDGVIRTHKTWAECERRVKGVKGAKYKKAVDLDDEKVIIEVFTGGATS